MSGHVLEQLSAYLDNELVPADRAALEAHLRECPECARRLEELAALDDLARGLPAEPPEGYFTDFAARVRSRVVSAPAERKTFRLPTWALAAAAALALGVTIPALLRRQSLEPAMPAREGQEQDRLAQTVPAVPPPAADTPAPASRPQVQPATPLEERKAVAPGSASGEPSPAKAARQKEYAEPHGVDGGVAGRLESAAAPAENANQPSAEKEQERRDVDEKLRSLGYVAEAPLQKKDEAAAADQGYASAPPAAPALEGASVAAKRATLAEGKDKANAATDAVGASRFRELLGRRVSTLEDARALREAWRVHATLATGSEADEARVRVLETGAQVYRLGRDAQDLALLEKDVAAYLARPDALQAQRARAALTLARSVRP